MRADKLALDVPARVLIVGYPGSGKTGALVQLANEGMKLRVMAYDKKGNMATLLKLVKPEVLPNIDIVFLEDKLKMGNRVLETSGQPTAFAAGFKLMNHWKYKEADGTEVDLGKPSEWGPDVTIALDSLSSQGDAALRRARALANRTIENGTDTLYNLAMTEQEGMIEALMHSEHRFNVVVISHLGIYGPKDVRKGEDDLSADIKRASAELIPTRLYPKTLGWKLPQTIGRHFPVILEAARKVSHQGKVTHVLKSITKLDMDLRIPAKDFPAEISIEEQGLVPVFDAVAPQWRQAVANTKNKE